MGILRDGWESFKSKTYGKNYKIPIRHRLELKRAFIGGVTHTLNETLTVLCAVDMDKLRKFIDDLEQEIADESMRYKEEAYMEYKDDEYK